MSVQGAYAKSGTDKNYTLKDSDGKSHTITCHKDGKCSVDSSDKFWSNISKSKKDGKIVKLVLEKTNE